MAAPIWSPRALGALVGCAALVNLLQACGSRSDTEDYLFGADGPIGLGATASSAGRPATGGSGGRNSGGAGAPAIAGTGANAGFGAGGSGSIAGAPAIAGQGGVTAVGGAVGTGGVTVAGAAGAPAGDLRCGDESCDSATQSCCLAGDFQCIPQGQACNGPVLGCTSQSDCPGAMCCLSLTGDAASASSCKPSCGRMSPARERQLCDTDADCQPPFRFCRATVFGLNLCVFRP